MSTGDRERSALSLDPQALPPEAVPAYPTYRMKRAVGGEETYDLVEEGPVVYASPRPAVPGEVLREPDLKFIADWSENLKERARLWVLAEQDEDFRALQINLCRSSVLYFINLWAWTYDPRMEQQKTIPFVTYPFQDEHIRWVLHKLRRRQRGLSEKSRDMGASWVYVAVACWLCLFHEQMTIDFMSQIEDDVDDRTEDSLLGKCRFLLNNLPEWMRGRWVERDHGCDRHMLIRIPATGSMIQGILSRGTAGRSGRATMVIPDEWAFVEDSENVLKAINDLSNCIMFLSTANGTGNAQYRMRNDPSTDVKRLHWTDHPLKNPEWARLKKQDMTEQAWAAEHEIDYAGSLPGKVYPKFVSAWDGSRIWSHVQDGPLVEYDPHFDTDTGQDYGMSDMCAIAFAQVKPAPPEYRHTTPYTLVLFDEYEDNGETVDGYRYLLNEKGYVYRHHVGDQRTGNQRDSLGATWIKNFRRLVTGRVLTKRWGLVNPGDPIIVKGRYNSEFAPIQTVQRLIERPGALAVNRKKCTRIVMAFQNWSYPTEPDPVTGQEVRIPGSKPKHDQFSHMMKAIAYLADYLFGFVDNHTPQRPSDWNYPSTSIRAR